MKRYFLYFCLLAITFGSCSKDSVQIEKDRPHNPSVFRSVLDEQPRMLTLALHEDLWAAYSVADGSIYKTWKGLVNFEGAVYNTIHGPQPTTAGDSYFVNQHSKPWQVVKNDGENVQSYYNYRGHKIENGNPTLMYSLVNKDFTIDIEEEIDAFKNENGQLVFERIFSTKNVPQGHHVTLATNVSSIVIKQSLTTDGELTIIKENTRKKDAVEILELDGSLKLNNNATTRLSTTLVDNALIPNKFNPSGIEEEEENAYEGAKLIAKSDCKTCHNKKVKTIGPSYVSIANKYKTTADNVTMLVNKVKNGGSGVWGEQIMNAHPDMSETDLTTIVNYILGLDKDDEGEENDEASNDFEYWAATEKPKEEDLIPGSVVNIFKLSGSVPSMPNMTNKIPIMAGIMANFDNISSDDWKDLEDNFCMSGIGYLHVEKRQEFVFRVWSDDGSKVYLDGKPLLDNDGNHGVEYKEITLGLEEGYHPFRIEFFQGVGGKFLSWNWKKEGAAAFEVIPQKNIFHTKSQQKSIGDLSLPMSSIQKIPGNKSKLTEVHPSFTLTQARPDDFSPKVGGMDFLDDGRLVISCWDATGSVYILDNITQGDPSKITTKKIADGLAEPLGLKVVDNDIYVMQKQEMTKLVDTNGDDIIDVYETLCDDWEVTANFHEFGFGLDYKDGHFYATLATGIQPGGAGVVSQPKIRGSLIKVSKETGKMEVVANGFRTPNGVGVGYNDDIYVADNQGDWLPCSKIAHVEQGDWFGSRAVDFEGTAQSVEKKPLVWLPQDEIGNSPSTPSYLNIGPYKNQMIHGEVTNGGVKRVFVEEVNNKLQGCVFRFIQGIESGVNRLTWGPDNALYVGGIGSTGNWGQNKKLWYGLQRLEYNETSTFEMLAVRAKSNGIEIEFTEALQNKDGWNPEDYEVRQWNYKPTADYGGPKLDHIALKVLSSSVSDDRKKVFLELDGMKDDRVVYLNINNPFISENGNSIWSTEAWYTMNYIPTNNNGKVLSNANAVTMNTLSPSEIKDGWELLFNGKDMSSWTNFNKTTLGKGWKVENGAFTLYPEVGDGGDIVSKGQYENFELKLEWKISNCGNSGIMYNVVQDEKYCCPWLTGPEMQILDNTCHPDTRYVTHRAGDLYDMIECKYVTVKPAGEWNKVILKVNQGNAEFYLNGYSVVKFKMFDDNWSEMIANSKFKDMPDFGLAKKGHISLQDHSDIVSFRNIKIKSL